MAVARLFKPGAVFQCGIAPPVQDLGNLPGLRMSFTCERSITARPDRLTLQIYNLAPETRTLLTEQYKPGLKVAAQFNAGFGPKPPRLILGSIVGLNAKIRVGPDVITQFDVADGEEVINEIQLGLPGAPLTVPQMIDLAVKGIQAGLALSAATPAGALLTTLLVGKDKSVGEALAALPAHKLSQRITVANIGKAWDLIEEAARILGVHAWVSNGLLRMSSPIPSSTVIPIPFEYWLGDPVRDGALTRLPTLMDPLLVPGAYVLPAGVDGPLLPQPGRIEHVTYSGDTRGGPWSASLTIRDQVYA